MATTSVRPFSGTYSAKGLCRIVGIACLAGFLVDVATLAFPPAIRNIEWRAGLLQQVGDRSIVLLFGLALLMYGIVHMRQIRRQLAVVCLAVGVAFLLSGVFVMRDSLKLRDQAMRNIDTQAATIQTQIQEAEVNPPSGTNFTPEDLERARTLLTDQAENLKKNAQTSLAKSGISSIGNLLIVGMALIGLGQYGLRPPKE